MDKIYVADTVIDRTDYQEITKILKEGDPFVLSPSNIKEKYTIDQYRLASLRGDVKLKVLLDNNIFTRILPLAKGISIEGNEQGKKAARFACSIMSFFIMGGFDIEFSLPLYERAYSEAEGSREEDLYYFRVADNLHPQVYADVAVGKKDSFPSYDLEFARDLVDTEYTSTDCSDFENPPILWKHIYLKLLEACKIWKDVDCNITRVSSYLQWVRESSLFIPATESFVLLFFSENRLSKMIKGINSANKEKLIHGVRNAAWDLKYITYWGNKAEQEQGQTIWFLCSNDNVLKKIAELMLIEKGNERNDFLKNIFMGYWGYEDGFKVFTQYQSLEEEVLAQGVKRKDIVRGLERQIDSAILSYEEALKT